MAKALLVLVALVALIATSSVDALQGVPNYTVDLDADPEMRWYNAVKMVVKQHGFKHSIGGVLDEYYPIFWVVPEVYIELISGLLKSRFPDSYKEAMGIAKAVHDLGYTSYNKTFFTMMPYFYEIAHIGGLDEHTRNKLKGFARACTGILSLPEDKSEPMVHGRNLDERPMTSRNMTMNITFMKNGTYLYNVFDYTWVTTGAYTASRIGGVTLEENWRDYHNPVLPDLVDKLKAPGTVPVALLFRHVQEHKMDFDEAVTYLTTTDLAAPAYIIMSGPARRGAILTLYFHKKHNVVEYLNDTSSVTFKVQTNYDRWLPDPPHDPRRTVAENALTTVGRYRSGTEMGVWMALSTYPVHNTMTMFTALMRYDEVPVGFVREPMLPDPQAPEA